MKLKYQRLIIEEKEKGKRKQKQSAIVPYVSMCGPCGTLHAIEIKNVDHSTQTKGEIERERGEENKRGEREAYGERRRLAIRAHCSCLLVADSRRCEEIGWGSL